MLGVVNIRSQCLYYPFPLSSRYKSFIHNSHAEGVALDLVLESEELFSPPESGLCLFTMGVCGSFLWHKFKEPIEPRMKIGKR